LFKRNDRHIPNTVQFLDKTVAPIADQIFASLIVKVLWDVIYLLCGEVSALFSHDLLKLFHTLSEVRVGTAGDIKIGQREV